MGPMSHLLPGEKLEEQLPKLIPGILALYKKHTEAFYISKVSSKGSPVGLGADIPAPAAVGRAVVHGCRRDPRQGSAHPREPCVEAGAAEQT